MDEFLHYCKHQDVLLNVRIQDIIRVVHIMIQHFQQQEDELHRSQQQISKLFNDYTELQRENKSILSYSQSHQPKREQESSFFSSSTISSFTPQSTSSIWNNGDGKKQYSSSTYTY